MTVALEKFAWPGRGRTSARSLGWSPRRVPPRRLKRIRGENSHFIEACPDNARRLDHGSLPLRETAEAGSEDLLHPYGKPESIELGRENREPSLGTFSCSHDGDQLIRTELKRKFDREERAPVHPASKE